MMANGMDVQDGKEGGTWFGVNKITGKFGMLLNITEQFSSKQMPSRGFLVVDFLTSGSNAEVYLQDVERKMLNYNGFNLILGEKCNDSWKIYYCCNRSTITQFQLVIPDDGIIACGNSPLNQPFCNVTAGKELFSDIVKNASNSQLTLLKDNLFTFLGSKTSYLPDEQLKQSLPEPYNTEEILKIRSCIFKDPPNGIPYGTRTQTLFLVDDEGNCDLTEKTLIEPIETENRKWNLKVHNFAMA